MDRILTETVRSYDEASKCVMKSESRWYRRLLRWLDELRDAEQR